MSEKLINLENIHKDYGGKTVLDNINLYVRDKEFVTLLGPSGCGKTTTLRIIGGFETPSAGVVYFDGKKINDVPPHKRQVNTVFQRYALFSHMDVYDNIAFGLRISKVKEAEINDRVNHMLNLVNLPDYGGRSVLSLSGGEQQRIAIARALVNHPRVLLLDEPLGALDLKLRKDMQRELKVIQQQVGITFVYVTHDQEEALTMSDTIVVMNKGKIQQIGTPVDIYNEPKNAFVADFIGESNIIDGIMNADKVVTFCGKTFDCLDSGFAHDEAVDVVVRPEDFEIVKLEDAQLTGTVKSVVFMGVHYEIMVETELFTWMVHSIYGAEVGDTIGLYLTPDDIHIMRKS
ncbi:MAG: spermidine/putrescine ABC transporter ATP-binding protein [Clostridiaceae bacterium]|nr:spermidine/putrescine ABC transporter ATP-binding protein [Clostridiaceae bacterium]